MQLFSHSVCCCCCCCCSCPGFRRETSPASPQGTGRQGQEERGKALPAQHATEPAQGCPKAEEREGEVGTEGCQG